MAQELTITLWCDVCEADDNHTRGETVTMPPTLGLPAFVVELCEHHAQPLADALAFLARHGRAPTKGKAPATPRTTRPDQRPHAMTCPTCGHASPNQSALRYHVRRVHGQSLADVGLEASNFECPECHSKFPNGQGMASHLRVTHGITGVDIHTLRITAENPGKTA